MITTIILLTIGILLIIIATIVLSKFNKIKKKGIVTEGVVFDLESSTNANNLITYPIIRFATQKNEWITEPYKIGIFPGFYKKGSKVSIIYDPQSPASFFINSSSSHLIPKVILIVGLIIIIFGALNLVSIKF